MSFTRKYLKTLGLTEEQVEAVIEAHTEVTDAQKATITDLTEKAAKADELQKELDKLAGGEDWQKKYTEKDKEFRDFKATVEAKERESAVKAAYRELLVEEHVGERQIDAVLGVTNFSDMKLDKDGKLENVDALKETIKQKWSGFITTEQKKGANVPTPPNNPSSGANPRAAEIEKRFFAQRYGTPTNSENK